ncbi:hypothetical protein PHMEG_00018743, partial [Phytophthora megakarya]
RNVEALQGARANGVDLVRNAYQWANQRLLNDPDEFPDVHLVHWRWWMTSRLAFFMCGLHAPLQGIVAQGARRRKKENAQAERNVCTSFMIETWGWYGTLHRMKASGHRTLYLVGRSARQVSSHREYTGPLLDDRSALFKKNGGTFLQRLRDVPPHWAGDITTGICLKLCQSERILDLRITIERELTDGSYPLPTTTPYDEKKARVVGVTPLMNFDGSYTSMHPLNPIHEWDDKQGLVINLSEDDEDEDGEVVEAATEGSPHVRVVATHFYVLRQASPAIPSRSKCIS